MVSAALSIVSAALSSVAELHPSAAAQQQAAAKVFIHLVIALPSLSGVLDIPVARNREANVSQTGNAVQRTACRPGFRAIHDRLWNLLVPWRIVYGPQ
jgi:hypothetical protein